MVISFNLRQWIIHIINFQEHGYVGFVKVLPYMAKSIDGYSNFRYIILIKSCFKYLIDFCDFQYIQV